MKIGIARSTAHCVLNVLILLPLCQSAAAQRNSEAPKWEIELHGVPAIAYHAHGSSTSFPQGQSITVFQRPLILGTRRVSSWYFGDGAALFNTAAATNNRPIPQIVSLDSVLTTPGVKHTSDGFGARLSRRITRRISAELSVEHNGSSSLDERSLQGIEATRSSFVPAFQSVLGQTVSSVSTTKQSGNSFTFSTGGVSIETPSFARVQPFVTLSAGVLTIGGGASTASLVGSYDQGFSGTSEPITDTVTMTIRPLKRNAFTGFIGGGIKLPVTSHFGIRMDLGGYVYHDPFATFVSAQHTDPRAVAFLVTDERQSISTFFTFFPLGSLVGLPGPPPATVSTLSGPAVSDFKSFSEHGVQNQIRFSMGAYWRF